MARESSLEAHPRTLLDTILATQRFESPRLQTSPGLRPRLRLARQTSRIEAREFDPCRADFGETSTSSVEPLGPDFAETPSFNSREFVSIRG
jgi:hypothetical protein